MLLGATKGDRMIKVVGVRFRKAGKIYYFDPAGIEIEAGQHVIVETVRGIEFGSVVLGVREIEEDDIVQPLKKVIRVTSEEDDAAEVENKKREREAYEVCLTKIRKHELDMKLIDCEYTFDNNKLLFYFTADGRIDFRDLVKDLASVFKTRIELRQIGVRDETKMIGSIGICGRTLCCHSHLSDFHPVSIKMAKDQNLSLNPTKISGVCGRLMCCLKYEEETYKELNKNLPRVGEKVRISETGEIAEVINTNIIRQLVKLVLRKEDGTPEIFEKKLTELEIRRGGKNFVKVAQPEETDVKEVAKKAETSDKTDRAEAGNKQNKKRPNRSRNNKNRQNNQKKQQDNKGEQQQNSPKQNNKPKKNNNQPKQNNQKQQNNDQKNKPKQVKNNPQTGDKQKTNQEGKKDNPNKNKNRNKNRNRNRNRKPQQKQGEQGKVNKEKPSN